MNEEHIRHLQGELLLRLVSNGHEPAYAIQMVSEVVNYLRRPLPPEEATK